MTNKEKGHANRFMMVGGRLPIEIARKLKSILAARGEFFIDWLERVAKAEIDGTIVFGVGQHVATRQNAEPARKEAGTGLPGE